MKLVSCHIENFGKFHDDTINFSEGLHIVCEENGWGKSTLAAFIKAMFYGLEGERKRSIEENERKRYKPWQGGVFGGQLVFEIRGKQYQVSRIFKDKEANDEFELRAVETNLPSKDYSEKLGEEIFKINSESYARTVYIGQNACETSSTDDINAKIGNLTDNSNDLNNFDSAYARLTELLNAMTPKRVTGSIAKRKNEITSCERMINDGRGIGDSMDAYRRQLHTEEEKYHALKIQMKEVGDEQAKVSRLQSVMDKAYERVSLYQMTEAEQQELSVLEDTFVNGVPAGKDVDAKIAEASMLQRLSREISAERMSMEEKARLEELESYFAGETYRLSEVVENWSARNNKKAALPTAQAALTTLRAAYAAQQEKTAGIPLLSILGIILAVLGIAVAVMAAPLAGVLVVILGIAFSVIGFLGNRKTAKAPQAEMLQEIEAMQRAIDEDQAFIARVDAQTREYLEIHGKSFEESFVLSRLQEIMAESMEYSSLKKKEQRPQADAKEAEADALRQQITVFLGQYQISSAEARFADDLYKLKADAAGYLSLRDKQEKYKQARADCQQVRGDVVRFLEEYGYEAKEADKLPSLEGLNQRMLELTEEMEASHGTIVHYHKILENLQEQYDDWEEKCGRLDELKEAQNEEQSRYEHILLARQKLSCAKETMTAQYADPILKGFCRYYTIISGRDGAPFHIDANTNVTVDELGKQREVISLSSGYQDMIGICLRAALVDAMYQDELPMLIMDDPFANLDDEKIRAGRKFVEELAGKYQILYFTCSHSRSFL